MRQNDLKNFFKSTNREIQNTYFTIGIKVSGNSTKKLVENSKLEIVVSNLEIVNFKIASKKEQLAHQLSCLWRDWCKIAMEQPHYWAKASPYQHNYSNKKELLISQSTSGTHGKGPTANAISVSTKDGYEILNNIQEKQNTGGKQEHSMMQNSGLHVIQVSRIK